MVKKEKVSHFEEQKKTKPTPRSIIDLLSNEELRRVGLEFLEYLSGLHTNPIWYATNSYNVNYKGKRVCLLRIDPKYRGGADRLLIHLYAPDKQAVETHIAGMTDGEKQFYLDGVKRCSHCGGCSPGVTVTVGRVLLNGMCRHFGFRFDNPTPGHLQAIKKLIELRRQDICK